MPADRNLLYGILAVQMGFVTRDALIAAMNAWVLAKHRPLGELLCDHGTLTTAHAALLDQMVDAHLELHGGDASRSLAALTGPFTPGEALRGIADADVQASLAALPADATGPELLRLAGPRFRVLRPHARGGLGEVFVAEDTELGRHVALKEIQPKYADDPGSRSRFVLEAEVTGGLEHPNIVPVYSLGRSDDGRPFYAMRFVKGESLKEVIDRHHATAWPSATAKALAFRDLLKRFVDVCNAVAYAHSRGVLHRDLKPGNVMLGKYGETLLVDWGLAKPLAGSAHQDADGDERTLVPPSSGSGGFETVAGAALGTPAFMSPEQAAGRLDELGPAADVYSLGATLYALVTGEPPFTGDVPAVLAKVGTGDYPRPRAVRPDVPRSLDAVVRKAMAHRVADRYSTAPDLAADVERYLADEPVTAMREPVTVRASRWMRRHQRAVGIASGALLVFVTMLIVGRIAGLVLRRQTQNLTNRTIQAIRTPVEEGRRSLAQNDRPGVAKVAADLTYVATGESRHCYNAACLGSLIAGMPTEGATLRTDAATAAVALLRLTPIGEQHDFKSPAALLAHMLKDTDLDPLRARPEFQAFVKELKAAPPTPAKEPDKPCR